MSARKDCRVIMESLELQCVAGRIEKKERRLFSRQSFETNAGFDDEGGFSFRQPVGKCLPILHGKNCTEMTHRHLIAINLIMCFVSDLIRA